MGRGHLLHQVGQMEVLSFSKKKKTHLQKHEDHDDALDDHTNYTKTKRVQGILQILQTTAQTLIRRILLPLVMPPLLAGTPSCWQLKEGLIIWAVRLIFGI